MKTDLERKELVEIKESKETPFLLCARFCEFKKCCKKYKRGDRCKKCPKK